MASRADLAGVTRGWELSTATPAWMRFIARPTLWLLNLGVQAVHPKGFSIQQIKRGAPFVVESRPRLLQVELASRKAGSPELPLTVLLLGSKDEFVSPADAMDLGPSGYCSYIEVPESSHMSIFDLAGASQDPTGQAAITGPSSRPVPWLSARWCTWSGSPSPGASSALITAGPTSREMRPVRNRAGGDA